MTPLARADRAAVLWAGAALAALYLVFLNPHLDVKGFNAHDPAAYLNRAGSLWRGEGYGERFADAFFPVTIQPPGFSVLLAPVVGLTDGSVAAAKLFMVSLAALLAAVSLRFFREFLPSRPQAAWATLALMASPFIFGLSHRVLAEIPLGVLVLLALVSLNRYLKAETPVAGRELWFAAAWTALGYLFKPTAVAVVAGGWLLLCHPKFRSRATLRKLLIYTALVALPIAAWQLWCRSVPTLGYWSKPLSEFFLVQDPTNASSPSATLGDWLVRMRHNLVWGMVENIAMSVIAPFYLIRSHLWGFILGLPVVAWLAGTWLVSCRRSPSVLEGFVAFGMLVLLAAFLGSATRYMAMFYPVFLVYACRSANASAGSRWTPRIFQGLFAAACATTLAAAVDQWRDPFGSPLLRDYVSLSHQARERFGPGSLCRAPLSSHWEVLTGHLCFSSAVERLPAAAPATAPDYFIAFSDQAPRDVSKFKDVEGDLMKGASRITAGLEQSGRRFETLAQNATFALLREEPRR